MLENSIGDAKTKWIKKTRKLVFDETMHNKEPKLQTERKQRNQL